MALPNRNHFPHIKPPIETPKERAARIRALQRKYDPNSTRKGPVDDQGFGVAGGPIGESNLNSPPNQEVSGVASFGQNGEGNRGQGETTSLVKANSYGEKPLSGNGNGNGGNGNGGGEIQIDKQELRDLSRQNRDWGHTTHIRKKPQFSGKTIPGERRRERGRVLARVLRIEFDPAFLLATIPEKATAAGLFTKQGVRRLVEMYNEVLNSADYVAGRRQALESFELEMDASTAVCLAEAAKRDPQYAVLRRRLRQMDEKRRVGGDQRDQFGSLMSFLKGETDAIPQPSNEGTAGINDRADAGESGLPEQDDQFPIRLEPSGSPVPERGEDEAGEE